MLLEQKFLMVKKLKEKKIDNKRINKAYKIGHNVFSAELIKDKKIT